MAKRLNAGVFCFKTRQNIAPDFTYKVCEMKTETKGQPPLITYIVIQREKE